MNVVVSQQVAQVYGARINAASPGARLVVPAVAAGSIAWSGDVARVDVCFLSEDMWQDLDQRRLVLPAIFQLPDVRWLHTFSAGVDAPVFRALIDRGTVLTNSSGASARSIAQYVLAMMLHRAKRISDWAEQQRRGEWAQIETDELTARTVCVIGTGAIGSEVARLSHAFGMHVVGIRRRARPTKHVDEQLPPGRLLEALARSDYVVLACPLIPETTRLIGERELRAMRPSATLINVARGAVVDEPALVRALREGWIAGACLDVFEAEPLPAGSELWALPNVVVTPHNAGFSPHNMERVAAIFIDNLDRYARGKPLRNRVR